MPKKISQIFILIFLVFAGFHNLAVAQDVAKKLYIPESEPSDDDNFLPDELISKPSSKSILKPISRPEKSLEKTKETTTEAPKPEAPPETNLVVLQGLNKVMGRVYTLEIPLGTVARFENLEIIARKCVKSKPNEPLENAALLEIREVKTDEEPKQVFLGWMFSSSPSISSLEHPVYDVTVISCEARANLETD